MKFIRIVFIAIIFTTFFSSCKKHRNNLVAKTWTATSIKYNGQEQMTAVLTPGSYFSNFCMTNFTYNSTYKIKSFIMDMRADGSYTQTQADEFSTINTTATDNNCAVSMSIFPFTNSISGTWSLSSDGKKITLVNTVGGITQTIVYDVLELKRKSMKWKGIFNGNTEEYSFVI